MKRENVKMECLNGHLNVTGYEENYIELCREHDLAFVEIQEEGRVVFTKDCYTQAYEMTMLYMIGLI